MCDKLLREYFVNHRRPIHTGNKFVVRSAMHALEFSVVGTKPEPYCIVDNSTDISFIGVTSKAYKVRIRLFQFILISYLSQYFE